MTDEVIDFVGKRNEAIEQRRREFERVMFQHFLGVYTVLGDQVSDHSVDLVDISDKGCLIQFPWEDEKIKKFKKDTELSLRIYFTQTSFLPLTVKIKYCTEFIDQEGKSFLRYGGEFDRNCTSFEAMESFIKFIYKFAEHSCADRSESRQSTIGG